MTTLQFLLEPGEGLRSLRARGFPGTGVLLQRWPWKDNAREQQGVTSRIHPAGGGSPGAWGGLPRSGQVILTFLGLL